MQGPSDEQRLELGARVEEVTTEGQLEDLLEVIEAMITEDIGPGVELGEGDVEQADNELAAMYAWASVVSYVVVFFYGPTSPFHRMAAGWAKKVVARIQKIANKIAQILRNAVSVVGATGFSISVGAPWPTLAIALNW
ncbi:hypothetical protein [Kitasatospora sp. NPDC001527]|uniref:hypothetical protein n=1 Tax=Kitasatospora sp. NPDC001527 TaxID=3154519 RepID=UPI003331915B